MNQTTELEFMDLQADQDQFAGALTAEELSLVSGGEVITNNI